MRPSVARALLRSADSITARPSLRSTALLQWQFYENQGAHYVRSCRKVGSRATYSTRNTSQQPASQPSNDSTSSLKDQKKYRTTTLPFQYPPEFGFVFDIDGVLLRSSEPIPGARESIQFLQDNNIPYTLLTNGGGVHEVEKAADVSEKLGVKIPGHLVVVSHSPFQDLAQGNNNLETKPVFVTGSNPEKCREIAESYGFKNVITPGDIVSAEPNYFPHEPLMHQGWRDNARELPRPVYKGAHPKHGLLDHLEVSAILVFNEPRDWALNIQIIVDLMMSHRGVLGSNSSHNGNKNMPNKGFLQNEQPRVYLSNPDLIWSTAWHQPRLGMGAFNHALARVWEEVTDGAEMFPIMLGKPNSMAYSFAEAVLNNERLEHFTQAGSPPNTSLARAYMVGDNPQSDIRGANNYVSERGTAWNSILVRTGLSESLNKSRSQESGSDDPVPMPSPKTLQNPTAIADDVREAVRWALKNEGIDVQGKL